MDTITEIGGVGSASVLIIGALYKLFHHFRVRFVSTCNDTNIVVTVDTQEQKVPPLPPSPPADD